MPSFFEMITLDPAHPTPVSYSCHLPVQIPQQCGANLTQTAWTDVSFLAFAILLGAWSQKWLKYQSTQEVYSLCHHNDTLGYCKCHHKHHCYRMQYIPYHPCKKKGINKKTTYESEIQNGLLHLNNTHQEKFPVKFQKRNQKGYCGLG